MLTGDTHRSRGRRIRPIGIEQHRDAHPCWWDHRLEGHITQFLGGGDIGAANKQSGSMEVFGPTSEDRSVNQGGDLLGFDAPIREQFVNPRINGDDAIKNAGMRVTIELY
jgi:hypothetical protein